LVHVSDIKLIRTDTTLDLSQKAEKGMLSSLSCFSFYTVRLHSFVQYVSMWDSETTNTTEVLGSSLPPWGYDGFRRETRGKSSRPQKVQPRDLGGGGASQGFSVFSFIVGTGFSNQNQGRVCFPFGDTGLNHQTPPESLVLLPRPWFHQFLDLFLMIQEQNLICFFFQGGCYLLIARVALHDLYLESNWSGHNPLSRYALYSTFWQDFQMEKELLQNHSKRNQRQSNYNFLSDQGRKRVSCLNFFRLF